MLDESFFFSFLSRNMFPDNIVEACFVQVGWTQTVIGLTCDLYL